MKNLEEVIKNLRGRFFGAELVATKEEARERILELIPSGSTVGVGGSMSVRELGVVEELKRKGHEVYDHWQKGLPASEIAEIRRRELLADVFLSSVNAVTRQGELLAVDGIGNRVGAMAFGPKKVILVVGRNKVVENLDEAFRRIKEVAAPMNARRLNLDLPCAKGECVDCRSPGRICRIYTILAFKPQLTDLTVILVNEDLGY